MNREYVALIFAALTLTATSCQKPSKSAAPAPGSRFEGYLGVFPEERAMALKAVSVYAGSQRFIAERHKLEVITSESGLQKSWESAVTFCGTIQCEVVSSNITTRTGDSLPSGAILLRVVPDDLKKLLAYVEKLGKIAQHTTEREDKTTAVVDTEAKIKNLTSFRDNLRTMLGKPSATVNDLVEIQKQLTDTQSELDSETAQRKILANETEKIVVEISFRVERPSGNTRGLAQIWNTLRESGSVLADSTSSLIYTLVAVVPWLILIVPGVWLLAKAWRKLKQRRTGTASSPPAPTAS
jgi:hypothetical protein